MSKITFKPAPDQKYFSYYPQLLVVVGVQHGKKVNFMPVAWSTALSYNPFLYGVSIGTTRFTHLMLEEADSFSVNFLGFEHTKLVRSLGRSSGAEMEKVKEFNLKQAPGPIGTPLLFSAYCTFECQKKEEKLYGDHTFFVGSVETVVLEKKSIKEDGLIDTSHISPIFYLGVDHYVTLDHAKLLSLKSLPFYYKTLAP